MNENDIRKYYKLLAQEETEVRAIQYYEEKGEIKSRIVEQKHVSSADELVKFCSKWNGKANIFAGIHERRKGGTKGEDVIAVNFIPLDIDARRKKNLPSTDEELEKTKDVANKIISDFEAMGFKKPLQIMTGNGIGLLPKIPKMEVNDENRELIGNVIANFIDDCRKKYSNDSVEIDPAVKDLARILKIPGTMCVKGIETAERPHRLAEIISDYEIEEDTKLLEYLFVATKKNTIEKQKLEIDEAEVQIEFERILNKDEKLKGLHEGKLTDQYKSRSEAEHAEVSKLVWYGFNYPEIDFIMLRSKVGKWSEATNAYKQITFKKASKFIEQNIERPKSNETVPESEDKPVEKITVRFKEASGKFRKGEVTKITVDEAEEFLKMGIIKLLRDADKKKPITTLAVEDVMKKEIKPIEWLLTGWAPNSSTVLLAGKPGSCKSYLSQCLSVCAATGSSFLNINVKKLQHILIVDLENNEELWNERFNFLKKGYGVTSELNIDLLNIPEDRDTIDLTSGSDMEDLKKIIREKGTQLLIIDTLSRVVGSNDMSDNNFANEFFIERLKPLCIEFKDLNVLALYHLKKGTEEDMIDLVRGAGDWTAQFHVVIKLEPHKIVENRFVLTHLKIRRRGRQKAMVFELEADEPQTFVKFRQVNEAEERDVLINECAKEIRDWIIQNDIREFSSKKNDNDLDWLREKKIYVRSCISNACTKLVKDNIIWRPKIGRYIVGEKPKKTQTLKTFKGKKSGGDKK